MKKSSLSTSLIKANWQTSNKIQAFCTTRIGGVSSAPFDSFNLATHVEDDLLSVLKNRQILQTKLKLSAQPLWLDQQHTTKIIAWDGKAFAKAPVADAAWTNLSNKAVAVMTADCQPILITNIDETFVVAIHAGWQGLLNGIITKSILQLPELPKNLKVWIGPSISQTNFEVDYEFMQKFIDKKQHNIQFFKKKTAKKYTANLVGIAVLEMQCLGVTNITNSNLCTYKSSAQFYSYRRQQKTGRMASIIWLES